jgi:hypothetical protein
MMAPYATSSLTLSPYVYGPPHMYSLPSPSAPGPSTAPSQPTWDQAAFINAMNNFTLNNEGTDWIFDSGASSHMSSL